MSIDRLLKVRTSLLLGLGVSLFLGVLAPAASAKPKVALTLPDADAGASIAYSYATSGVPARAKLVLQRQIGTALHFKTVATLAHVPSGSGTLPGLDLGRYKLRVAVITRKRIGRRSRSVVTTQQKQTLSVYGTVPFTILFRESPETFAMPTRSFSYVFSESASTLEQVTTIDGKRNRCRSVHLDWVVGSSYYSGDPDASGTISLVQESRDAVTDTTGWNEISALDAVVTPRESWGINATTVGEGYLEFFVNGSASCYTRSLL